MSKEEQRDVEYRTCAGSCRLPKPALGLGSDGRCLDCRLEPIRSAEPSYSWSQRRKAHPKQTAYRGEDYP